MVHGRIPLLFASIFNPKSENKKFYQYIAKYGYHRHLFTFAHEYSGWTPEVFEDSSNGLYYVITDQRRRLYFKRGLTPSKIAGLYKSLYIEQDHRSPHCYWQSIEECAGGALADVGSAEGFSALEAIEVIDHLYLFEAEREWVEALEETFKPWKEKVTIVQAYVSNKDTENQVSLDRYFSDKSFRRLFVKMDIEGAEPKAIEGAKRLLCSNNVDFAICTYHSNDWKTIPDQMNAMNCPIVQQLGYFHARIKPVIVKKL